MNNKLFGGWLWVLLCLFNMATLSSQNDYGLSRLSQSNGLFYVYPSSTPANVDPATPLIKVFEKRMSRFPDLNIVYYSDTKPYNYSVHKLSLLYQTPQYMPIRFVPTVKSQEALWRYQSLMQSTAWSDQYIPLLELKYPLYQARRNLMFKNPSVVSNSWSLVPDAPDLGRGGYMRRRSADETIRSLVIDQNTDTRPKLEKVVITKGPWFLDGTENVQLAQAHLENWVKGGENSINISSDLRFKAAYKRRTYTWESFVIHKLGVLSTEQEKSRVNDDLIELNTKFGVNATKRWYYSFMYDFRTQFFNGYDKKDIEHVTPISGFMAPAYMTFALGMDYKYGKTFTLLLSPLTSKLTMVRDTALINPARYKIPEGEKSVFLHGLSVTNSFTFKLSKQIKLSSKLDGFYQYLSAETDKQIQFDWEVILDMRINRLLSTRLIGQSRYYTNESLKVQSKESFNIAFSYNF